MPLRADYVNVKYAIFPLRIKIGLFYEVRGATAFLVRMKLEIFLANYACILFSSSKRPARFLRSRNTFKANNTPF